MKNLTSIKQRISYFIENKGIKISNFYRESGVTYGILSQKSNISEGNIVRFLTRYPDVNPEWLITGQGAMLREPSAGKPQTAPVAAPAAMPERAPAIAEVAFYKEILEKKDVEIRELNREIGALQHANAAFRQQVATLQEQSRELVAVQHENTALKQQVADLLQEREDNKKNSAAKHDAAQLAVPEHQLHTQPYPEILMAAEPMKPYKRNQRAP